MDSGFAESASPGVLIIAGATASGKTDLAIALAQRYGAEIVGADSRQIYRGMPIGTAAPTPEQQQLVRHHLVGFVDPFERYSAARYVVDARAAIAGIHARGKRVIVAGGTGFYIRALCGDVVLAPAPNPLVRERLLREARLHPVDVLHDWLRSRDPGRAATISTGDPYRVVRALEIELGRSGRTPSVSSSSRALPTLRAGGIAYAKVALTVEPAELAERIRQRTDAMLARGLVAEAQRVGAAAVAADAVGYREALAYDSGWLTFEELRMTLARSTRRYAKRQSTWFRAEPDIRWLRPSDARSIERVVAHLGWYGR